MIPFESVRAAVNYVKCMLRYVLDMIDMFYLQKTYLI